MPITVKPFQHQVLGFNIGIQIPNHALLMEMGTGKTLTEVAILGRRYLDGDLERVLIVAPSSVVPVWPREFAAFAAFPTDVRALEGPVARRKKQLAEWGIGDVLAQIEEIDDAGNTILRARPPLQVAVTNYEATWRMREELAAWLAGVDGSAIVCDESQRIKTPSAAQAKCLHYLGARATFRAILTGTPVTQAPMDFFSQYKFLDPAIFGHVFSTFRARHAIMGGFEGREVIGYRSLDDLQRKALSVAFRVTKEECLDLPEQVDVDRFVTLEADAKRTYDKIAKDMVAELEQGEEITTQNVLTKLLRLQQITGGFVRDDEGVGHPVSTAKLRALEETLDEVQGKVVVFARFRKEIEAITALLEDRGMSPARIWGDTPMAERGSQVERFQTDDECRAFVAQIQTAGLGITLTAASTAVFYSLDFSFANYDQARSRLHRIGQTDRVTNVHLLARGSVDMAVMKALKRKRNVADAVVDGAFEDLVHGREIVAVEEFSRR
jgi:SNF2 family DNA or RNA helicase